MSSDPRAIDLCSSFVKQLDEQSHLSLWRLSHLAGVDEHNTYKARKGQIALTVGTMIRLAAASRLRIKLTLERDDD